MSDTIEPLYMTEKDCAKRYGISERSVRYLLAKGKIRAKKFGGGTRIEVASVAEYYAGLPDWKTGSRTPG